MRIQAIVAATAALAVAGSAAAQGAAPLQVSYPTDATLTCEQLSGEGARMDALTAASNQAASSAAGQAKGMGLASTFATEGLARSGLAGRVPGLGMFAAKANEMAAQRAAQQQQAAADQIQIATMRKTIMVALYQGKACGMAAPAATAAAVTPVSNTPAPAAH